MLKSPRLSRSSKVEKVENDKKLLKSPRLSRSSLNLMENPEKEKKLRCFSYSAEEQYAKETATQINYGLNFLRKKVLPIFLKKCKSCCIFIIQ